MKRRLDGQIDPSRIGAGAPGTVLTSDGLRASWQAPGGSAGTVAFARDRFPSSGTLSSSVSTASLTYTPLSDSLHLYLNGLELDEGSDYTLSGATITVLSAAGAGSGDVLEARYARDPDAIAGTPGVTYTFTDDFNRANNALTLGSPWSVAASGLPSSVPIWGVTSNTAYCVQEQSPGSFTLPVAYVDFGYSDVDLTLKFTTVPAGNEGLLFRCSADMQTYWYVGTAALVRFRQAIDGGQNIATWGASSAGDVMRVVANGSSIQVWRNGISLASVTDAAGVSNTRHGMIAVAVSSARFDNFALESL